MTNRSLSGQRIRPEEWLLIACILFTFLWRFVAMLWIPALYPLNDYFPMLWAALAACLARRGQTWRRRSVWILGAGLGLIFLRCLFGGMETLQGGLKAVSGGVLAFGVCYQAAFGLRKEALLSFLRLLLGLWTALATLLSLAGLWAALYDQVLSTPMGGVYVLGLQDNRLNLLGKQIADPHGVETGGVIRGMGLLPVTTELGEQKVRTRVGGEILGGMLDGCELSGYEIHMGISRPEGDCEPFCRIRDEITGKERTDGVFAGNVCGTYVHGIFDHGSIAGKIVRHLAERKGLVLGEDGVDYGLFKEQQYDKLAATLRKYLDLDAIYKMMREYE